MVRFLHFADLHIGVENYSRIDPETGHSTCLLDFMAALDQVVDCALEADVDLAVFCGDAYKNRDPSQTHQREFAGRIARLAANGIPVFLLVGNHDVPNAIGRATALDIFDTLSIHNLIVGNRPGLYPVPTRRGLVQIVALPWLRRGALLGRDNVRHSSFEELNQRLAEEMARTIEENVRQIDTSQPAILAAHLSLANAALGSERTMVLGQDPLLPVEATANPAFDYVALGHIHRHQVLAENPPVVYSGSVQAIDFSDEGDTKGFYLVEIDPSGSRGSRVSYEFRSTTARRFLTIRSTVPATDTDPTATVLAGIAKQDARTRGAIVRVHISIPDHLDGLLQEQDIHAAIEQAHCVTISKDIQRQRRTRLTPWSAEEMHPAEALRAYLQLKETSPEHTRTLLEYGEDLIRETLDDG